MGVAELYSRRARSLDVSWFWCLRVLLISLIVHFRNDVFGRSQLLLCFDIVLSFPGTKPARTWKNRTTQERHGRITSKFGRRQYEQQLNDAVGE